MKKVSLLLVLIASFISLPALADKVNLLKLNRTEICKKRAKDVCFKRQHALKAKSIGVGADWVKKCEATVYKKCMGVSTAKIVRSCKRACARRYGKKKVAKEVFQKCVKTCVEKRLQK